MAISAKSSVLTGNGWVLAKDIQPGDWVFNRLGKPVKVKVAQMYRSEECYRVLFDDCLSVDGDHNLAFPAEDFLYRLKCFKYKGVQRKRTILYCKTVTQMLEIGIFHRGTRKFFSVPTTEPIELPTQPLDIPPFLYGFWFYARKKEKYMAVPKEYAEEVYQNFKNSGYQVEKLGDYRDKFEKFVTTPSIWTQLAGKRQRNIGQNYLNGDPNQRLELLKGILYTKPTKKSTSDKSFIYKSRTKSNTTVIQQLTESLGCKTKVFFDNAAKQHVITVSRRKPLFGESRPVAHLARRYVKSIDPIPAQLCVHIETDEENSTFLVGEGFISCH